MSKTIIFHCRMPMRDEHGNTKLKKNGHVQTDHPTHTLAFHKVMDEDVSTPTIVMGWAVANRSCDDYDKKFGSTLSTQRVGDLLNRVYNYPYRRNIIIDSFSLGILPAVMVKNNLNYYLGRAVKSIFPKDNIPKEVKIIFYSTMDNNAICEYIYHVEV